MEIDRKGIGLALLAIGIGWCAHVEKNTGDFKEF
jgi:hypothetical protein